ncbi:MAG: pilin [Candidatus Paceibacterota bacterium]|jgi:predicted membrane channel-forming protein YqfA (hemolysin III family)
MKKKLGVLSGAVLSFMPLMALAQNATGCDSVQLGTIQSIICKIGNILDTIIPVLVVLGVVYFVWGVVTYVISSDEEAKKTGRMRMIYGIIGLVVIVAMWGLVGIVTRTFDLTGSANVSIPTVPF